MHIYMHTQCVHHTILCITQVATHECAHSNTHFVSSARATLSPVPARKAVAREDEREAVQESGIVETSIKASSVIKQFETRKISKIKPDGEVFVEGESGWVMAVFQLGAMRVSYHTIAA